jgi:hypothetical protein
MKVTLIKPDFNKNLNTPDTGKGEIIPYINNQPGVFNVNDKFTGV